MTRYAARSNDTRGRMASPKPPLSIECHAKLSTGGCAVTPARRPTAPRRAAGRPNSRRRRSSLRGWILLLRSEYLPVTAAMVCGKARQLVSARDPSEDTAAADATPFCASAPWLDGFLERRRLSKHITHTTHKAVAPQFEDRWSAVLLQPREMVYGFWCRCWLRAAGLPTSRVLNGDESRTLFDTRPAYTIDVVGAQHASMRAHGADGAGCTTLLLCNAAGRLLAALLVFASRRKPTPPALTFVCERDGCAIFTAETKSSFMSSDLYCIYLVRRARALARSARRSSAARSAGPHVRLG
jgi:hypothetical protein